MAEKIAGTIGRSNTHIVARDAILIRDGFNPRFVIGDVAELAASIAKHGVLQPIRVIRSKVDPTKFELLNGHRRVAAFDKLVSTGGGNAPEGIPAIVVPPHTSEVDQYLMAFIDNSGKPFEPIEQANAFKRMIDMGMAIPEVAASVGVTGMTVRNRLVLLEAASPELVAAVGAGEIKPTLATEIVRSAKGDADAERELLAKSKESKSARAEVKKTVNTSEKKKRLTSTLVMTMLNDAQVESKRLLIESGSSRSELREYDNYAVVFALGYEKALSDLNKSVN